MEGGAGNSSGPPSLPPRHPGSKKPLWSTAAPAAAGALAAYWAWLVKSASTPPRLWAGEGDLKSAVLPLCTLLHKPYRPAPLALNTHLQNILGYVRGRAMDAKYTRQLVIAHDGGTLGLDWYRGCDASEFGPSTQPVLLVLHGINGGSHEGYCKWVCHCATQRGWRGVVLNYRGCGGLPLTSPRGYAATLTHDVHYAITSIKARFPDAPLFAVGYSLGGVFLTKYLAESDAGLHASLAAASSAFEPFQGSGLVAAAVVSSPICLFNSSANLAVPWTTGYLYNLAVAFKLKEFMVHHQAAIRSNTVLDLDKALKTVTVAAIEDAGIPHSFGFKNRQEYYEQASSLAYIPLIKTPTLFLVSEDDPFLGVLPDQECAANPNTILAATARGGHVAFLQGMWPFGPAYMDAAVLQFMDATLHHLPAQVHPPQAIHQPAVQPISGHSFGQRHAFQRPTGRREWLQAVKPGPRMQGYDLGSSEEQAEGVLNQGGQQGPGQAIMPLSSSDLVRPMEEPAEVASDSQGTAKGANRDACGQVGEVQSEQQEHCAHQDQQTANQGSIRQSPAAGELGDGTDCRGRRDAGAAQASHAVLLTCRL